MAVQRPAGDVVDQREPGRDQRLARLRVARLGRAHEGRPGPALHVNVHGSALRPAVVRPPLPPRRPLWSAQITTIRADSENRRTARPPAGPVRARTVSPRGGEALGCARILRTERRRPGSTRARPNRSGRRRRSA